jgi:hypothetical protein
LAVSIESWTIILTYSSFYVLDKDFHLLIC